MCNQYSPADPHLMAQEQVRLLQKALRSYILWALVRRHSTDRN